MNLYFKYFFIFTHSRGVQFSINKKINIGRVLLQKFSNFVIKKIKHILWLIKLAISVSI